MNSQAPMNNKIAQLAERRASLVAQMASQRMALTEAFAPLHVPLTIADKGLHAFRYISLHPALMAGAVAIAVAVRPKRWLFVLENGWLAWRLALAAKRRLEG